MAEEQDNRSLVEDSPKLPPEFDGLELIGKGGSGTVYRSTSTLLGRPVAIKVLGARACEQSVDLAKQAEKIQKEAKIIARLHHPNIVSIYTVGACLDGRPFLACELLEGVTLDKFLAKSATLTKEEIRVIFPQILDALQFTHDNGLLHRDIKPSNIMLLKESASGPFQVKLLDFGIAKNMEAASTAGSAFTQTAMLSGTPAYMSPEQCQGKTLDARSDIYSVACMLHECLFGKPPFSGESTLSIQYRQIHEDPEKLESLRDRSDKSKLTRLLLSALAKETNKRPACAEAFKKELIEALAEKSLVGHQPKAILSCCLASLVLALLLFVCFACFGNRQNNSNQTISVTKPVYRSQSANISTESKLKKVLDAYINWCNHPRLANQAEMTSGLKELNKVLAASPSDHEALNFVAHFLKSGIYELLKDPASQTKCIEDALKCCTLPDGRTSYEAAYCYERLAGLEKNPGKKKQILEKAVAIISADNPATLEVPEFLKLSLPRQISPSIYRQMAENCWVLHDYKRALASIDASIGFLGSTNIGEASQLHAVDANLRKADFLIELHSFLCSCARLSELQSVNVINPIGHIG